MKTERIYISFKEIHSDLSSCGRLKEVWYGPGKDRMSRAAWEGDWHYGVILLDTFEDLVRSGTTGGISMGRRYEGITQFAVDIYVRERYIDGNGVERIPIGCTELRPERFHKVCERVRTRLKALAEKEAEGKR